MIIIVALRFIIYADKRVALIQALESQGYEYRRLNDRVFKINGELIITHEMIHSYPGRQVHIFVHFCRGTEGKGHRNMAQFIMHVDVLKKVSLKGKTKHCMSLAEGEMAKHIHALKFLIESRNLGYLSYREIHTINGTIKLHDQYQLLRLYVQIGQTFQNETQDGFIQRGKGYTAWLHFIPQHKFCHFSFFAEYSDSHNLNRNLAIELFQQIRHLFQQLDVEIFNA